MKGANFKLTFHESKIGNPKEEGKREGSSFPVYFATPASRRADKTRAK